MVHVVIKKNRLTFIWSVWPTCIDIYINNINNEYNSYLDTELDTVWQNERKKATSIATSFMLYTGERKYGLPFNMLFKK